MRTELSRRLREFWTKEGVEIIFYYGRTRMNQSELAKRMGVSSSWLTLVRTGQQLFSDNQLAEFCTIMGASAAYDHLLEALRKDLKATKKASRLISQAYASLKNLEDDCFNNGRPIDAFKEADRWLTLLDIEKDNTTGRAIKNRKVVEGKLRLIRVKACEQAWPAANILSVTKADRAWIRENHNLLSKNPHLYYFRSITDLDAVILKISGDRDRAAELLDSCVKHGGQAYPVNLLVDLHRDRIVNYAQLGDETGFGRAVRAALTAMEKMHLGPAGRAAVYSAIAIGYRMLADKYSERQENDIVKNTRYTSMAWKYLEDARQHKNDLQPYSSGMMSLLHADVLCNSRDPAVASDIVVDIGKELHFWARDQFIRSLGYLKHEFQKHKSWGVRAYAEEIIIPPLPTPMR